MSKYRTYIEHPSIGQVEVIALGIEETTLVSKLDSEETYYVRSLDGNLRFRNGTKFLNSYQALYDLTGDKACENITFNLFEVCDSKLESLHTSIIETKNINFQNDICTAEFKVSSNDLYSCMKRFWKDKVNHFQVESQNLLMSPEGAIIEEVTTSTVQQYPNTELVPFEVAPYPQGSNQWCIKKTTATDVTEQNSEDNEPFPFYEIKTYWWREVITVSSDIELTGWDILSENDNGTTTYWRCPIYSGNTVVSFFRNGRYWSKVVEYTITETLQNCTDKTIVVRSNFLGLNSEGASPSNIAYEASSKYHDVFIFQISDVVHHDYAFSAGSTGVTKQFELTLEEVLKINKSLWNLTYQITETDTEVEFRIEHYSYFSQSSEVIDMREEFGSNTFSSNLSLPERLKFEMQNSQGNDFVGTDIVFPSSCTDGEKNYRLQKISTDLAYLLTRIENSEGEYEANPDIKLTDNFVLIATDKIGETNYTAIDVGAITTSPKYNGRMSFANLHESFWLHNASAFTGQLNNKQTDFESVKFGIESGIVRKKFCCNDELKENAIYYSKSSDEARLTKEAKLEEFRLNLRTRTAEYKLIHGNNG